MNPTVVLTERALTRFELPLAPESRYQGRKVMTGINPDNGSKDLQQERRHVLLQLHPERNERSDDEKTKRE